MKTDALERLDKLITVTVNPAYLHGKHINDEQVYNWIEEAKNLKEQVRQALMHPHEGINKRKMLKLMVYRYQSTITYLSDTLYAYRREDILPIVKPLYKILLRVTESLLLFIYRRFRDYFNHHEKLPDIVLSRKQTEIKEKLHPVKKMITKQITGYTLTQALFEPLNIFTNSTKIFYTYAQYYYLFGLSRALTNIEWMAVDADKVMYELLIQWNFNSTACKRSLLQQITKALDDVFTAKAKKEILLVFQVAWTKIEPLPNKVLQPGLVTLKQDLLAWIETELQQYMLVEETMIKDTGEKSLQYNMTVEEIALMKRIEKESGLTKNTNITHLMQGIAPYIHSVNQYNISWQNLYNHFYKYNLTTVQSLNDKLFLMVNALRKLETKLKQEQKSGSHR